MPHNPIRVVAGPTNYFSHPGSFNHLHGFFTNEQPSHAVWIYGERVIAVTQTKLPSAFELPGIEYIPFRGHYNESDVQQLAAEPGDDRNVVIGVGGGALLDTVETLVRRLDLPSVVVPTIATIYTAQIPFSVWYNDAGQALHYKTFDDANFMVLLRPEIILNASREYLLAGAGDTLAKWYEAVVLALQPETSPLTMRPGINNVQVIHDVLLNSSEQALAGQQN